MKRKWLAVGIILLFVGTGIFPVMAHDTEKPLPASRGNWLYVGGSGPGNYTTIQSAIDDANPGDIVYVYSGTYTEKLVINKTIDVIGEDRDTTVIDGGGTTYVVSITSDGVMISGFTIQNGLSGIYLRHSSNSTITDNNASHNEEAGIHLYNSSNNTIMGNNAHTNTGYGILLVYSYNNIIEGNNVHSNTDFGIFLSFYSYDNIIESNNVYSNTAYGIFLYYCYNNIIKGNTVHSNTDIGIVLFSCNSNNQFYHNNLINNSQNAYDQGGNNTWDNGYPSGGNYWSDYTATDNNGDGIGDTPYNIPGDGLQDRYPFMKPNGWVNESPDLHINFTTEGIGVYAAITNNGTANATDVEWKIHVEGGIFDRINTTVDGTLDILMGESKTVSTGLFLGLGPFTVTARADDVEKTARGIILLFYVISIT